MLTRVMQPVQLQVADALCAYIFLNKGQSIWRYECESESVSSASVLPYFLGPHGLVQLKNAVCEICVIKRKDATQWLDAIGSAQSSNRIRMRRTKFLARSNLLLYIYYYILAIKPVRCNRKE
jgi:hypothetical protein